MSEPLDPRAAKAAAFLKQVTAVRIVLVPVVMGLIEFNDRISYAYPIAAAVFAVAAATDFIDGYLARRWGAVTALGSFLDTTADKLLVSGVLIALVSVGRASAWLALIIIGREFVVLGLRGVVAAEGTVFGPSVWGKLKANVQFLAITLAIVRMSERLGPLYLDEYAMIAAAAVTVLSAFEYLARFSSALSPSGRR